MNVRRIRLKQKMTQAELAEGAGISQGFLCNVERGRYSPSLATAQRIADALGVTMTQLTRSASRTDAQHLTTGGRGRRAAKGGGHGRVLTPRAKAAGKAG